jgi:hypothetical protein
VGSGATAKSAVIYAEHDAGRHQAVGVASRAVCLGPSEARGILKVVCGRVPCVRFVARVSGLMLWFSIDVASRVPLPSNICMYEYENILTFHKSSAC